MDETEHTGTLFEHRLAHGRYPTKVPFPLEILLQVHRSLWTESEQAGKWDRRGEFSPPHKMLGVCDSTCRDTSVEWKKTTPMEFIFSGNFGVDLTPIVRRNSSFRRPSQVWRWEFSGSLWLELKHTLQQWLP